ncbi:MAG: efflux RND transporter permease subunit [Tannerella sp.]|jgi:HAE1 family hydrophobic/amphiphilic exporter-1|nr:efflux RND transporter permease subunit [Tannerella sp.]
MSLYSTAVKNPVTTALVFVAIIILGIFSYKNLAVDLLPKIETNSIVVMTSYAGASASDIEMNVTRPIENILNGLSDLKHITSSSRENISVVSLEFEYGIDIDVATNDVRDKLDIVKSSLPDDVDNPVLFKFGADDIPIIILSVTAEESTNALYKILDDKVASPLARISGIGTVSISGTAQREIQVYCDPYKLDAYGMTIENISQLIGMENRNTPGGSVDIGSNTLSLRVQGEFRDANEMLSLVIGNFEGKAVYLRDVARVEDSVEERSQESYTDGTRGAMVVVQKQSGANSVNIAKEVHKRLPELQRTLPSDVKLGVIIDTSENINNTIDSLAETIMITLVIVMLVVFVFLGRWRATVIIGITIPVSLIASFIYLYATGNTLNIISLSSLSLAIGMVVDDSIVVLENITNHIERGSRPKEAAIYATKEVSLSVIASTLTMLAVFVPLTMISGMAGVLFRQLGGIISIIMIISTVAALTLIPMMSSQMLKLDNKKGKLYSLFFTPIEKFLGSLDKGYSRLLNWSVNHRTLIVVIAVALFGGSMLLLPTIKTEFFPTQDDGRISVSMELPVGMRQEISRAIAYEVAGEFREKYPEIKVLNYSLGQADASNTFANLSENGTYIISYNIRLLSMEDRNRSLTEICDLMRADLDKYTELKSYNVVAGSSGGMGGESTVDVEIYGYDFALTDAVAADLSERLKQYPECSQINISRGDYMPELHVEFDRQKLAMNGLNVTTVSSFLRNRVNGTVASHFREDGEEYDIRIRYAPEYRETVEDIENIMVYNTAGNGIRIRDIGRVVEQMTPPTIERKDRERIITVSGTVASGYALSDLVAVSGKVLSEMDLPGEVSYHIGGTYENQQEVFGDLISLMILIVILVFIVMAAQFESIKDSFVIMFAVPFTFTGVFLGLSVTNTPLGVMAMIGILILMGVVVKNGIVLIDYIKLNLERGMNLLTAVVLAGKSRLRPILMTTLTTVLGMLPMALGTGEGSEMWRSMGMTVAWGLSISTLITLVLIPVIYCIFENRSMKRRKKEASNLELLELRIEG